MNHNFKPHTEILRPVQQQLWAELKPTVSLEFVLYGGTAIALRLGHRTSVDFDFFSNKKLNRNVLYQAFSFLNQSIVTQDEKNALSVIVPYGNSEHLGVKVSFFGMIDIGRVGEPDLTEDGILQVASLDDLMATKLKVILQRAEAKDYRDIAQMIKVGVSLSKGLASARKMDQLAFQPSESLKALIYFEDGDLNTLTETEKEILIKAATAVRDLPAVTLLSDHELCGVPHRRQ